QSLDGKITTRLGQSKWITTNKSRQFSRKLRDKYDAVLVGAETLRKDNPKLNGLGKIPYKIIVSSSLDLPKNSYIFKNFTENTFIFTASNSKTNNKLPKNIKIFSGKANREGISLKKLLKKLYQLGIMSVFVEGGSDTLGRFFDQNLVDKVYFFIAPKVFGGKTALTSIGAKGVKQIKKSPELRNLRIKRIGDDILVWGYLKK
ncbi:MAG: RibD family protein, partial [Candidatus Omnitrophota bacterium]